MNNNKQLWRYAGLAMQFLVAIVIAIFLGLQIDKWFITRFPLAVWLLPLLVITGIILKIARETSTKK